MNIPYPLPKTTPYTGAEVKALFEAAGVPISTWAEANDYDRRKVYMVINGQFKGSRGASHDIAVKLGMKLSLDAVARGLKNHAHQEYAVA
ncbi:DNA-binding protein [Marinobacterium stanieri]|uniref:Phage-associated protein, BcepMu gp16 family n=1 Tax=Marinobacterium stanieri TaxID=49186 RepID=A0A1N6RNN6_9GAMM|nr:DNA-binding protein [Marinobacterium stanieri]SIQ30419.1 phage-associated protein, BcepMu gp16 family [Marinobacterium stanieri]